MTSELTGAHPAADRGAPTPLPRDHLVRARRQRLEAHLGSAPFDAFLAVAPANVDYAIGYRSVAGAVQCVPRRLTVVEEVVRGQAKTADTASLAGQSAVRGATPLNFNHFKIPLLQNLVTRAIRDA